MLWGVRWLMSDVVNVQFWCLSPSYHGNTYYYNNKSYSKNTHWCSCFIDFYYNHHYTWLIHSFIHLDTDQSYLFKFPVFIRDGNILVNSWMDQCLSQSLLTSFILHKSTLTGKNLSQFHTLYNNPNEMFHKPITSILVILVSSNTVHIQCTYYIMVFLIFRYSGIIWKPEMFWFLYLMHPSNTFLFSIHLTY